MLLTIPLSLVLSLATFAANPRVLTDEPHLWQAVWTVGSWHVDSSKTSRKLVATPFERQTIPGALDVPIAEATLVLPPDGTWSVDVRRDSLVEVFGSPWARISGWASGPIRPVVATPIEVPAWTEVATPQGRLLRLAIPMAEARPGGLTLARILKVTVTIPGAGSSSLANAGGAILSANSSFSPGRFAGRIASRPNGILPDGTRSLVVTVRNPKPGDLGQDGIVRLTGAQVHSQLGSLNGIAFDHIAAATSPRGSIDLIADSTIPEGSLQSIPIRRVDLDGDGVFEEEDRIEFFAHGPSFWAPDTELGLGLHQLIVHPWDLGRRYLVRLDAEIGSPELARGQQPSAPTATSTTTRPVWAGAHKHVRVLEIGGKDAAVDIESGASWFWFWTKARGLDSVDLRHEATRDLPGLVGTSGVGIVRLALESPSTSDTLRAYSGGSSPGPAAGHRLAWNLSGLRSLDNRWRWTPRGEGKDFESYSIEYPFLPSRAPALAFPTPRVGAFSLPITGATASDSVVAVVRGVGVRILPLTGGELRDSATDLDTWYVPTSRMATFATAPWKAPTGSRTLHPVDFASDAAAFEMLVVAPDSFLDLATQYADFRSDSKRIRPLQSKVARAEDLWLLYGHGSVDPLAIRDLLRGARARWGVSHVLLMGGGHFDPRGVTGAAPVALPVWEDQQVATDAVLTYLDPHEMEFSGDRTQDVALGRIPARSHAELAAWFAKERVWEDPSIATAGPWRNTILSVADDMEHERGQPDDNGHTESSENILTEMLSARPWLQSRKVYEVEYPMNAIFEKPDAQRALIDQLNRGVAAWNYMGHGGYEILSDERLLDTRSALLGLTNSQFPHLFYAGSCTVGRFDMVDNRGLAEALVVAAGKGAVAAITGTRPSFPGPNEALARNFWSRVLVRDAKGNPRTLGESFQQAKNHYNPGRSLVGGRYSNNDVYNLLGDPAIVPFPAGSRLSMDKPPDTIHALDARELRGLGESDIQVSLVTPPTTRVATFNYGSTTYSQSYLIPGRTLVSLKAKAHDGKYLARLITPARIPFGDTASLVVYGWNPSSLRDSAVIRSGIPMTGIGSNPPSDHQGPAIRILPCDSSWSGGQPFGNRAEIPVPFCLNIFFDDSSGISSNDAPDEGVILSVPGTLDPWHPAQLEEGGDFSRAWTRLSLDAKTFQPGRTYTLNVFARDLMGNASTKSVELHTRKAGEIDLYEVFNRPNPVKGNLTTFYFKLLADADSNGTVPGLVQASIRIHAISGKLVRILNTDLTEVGHPRPRAVWNLQDAFRNEVANGLYPYTIILRVKDESGGNWRQIEKKGIIAISR